jgi:hypothetical protein
LKSYRLCRHLAILSVIAGALVLLTGCQGLSGGNGAGSSNVAVANTSLNFGTVAVGSNPTMTDSIVNNTSSSVTIATITGVGYGFQVTGLTLPLVLAAGQSAPFTVQFQPSAAGDPTTTISFNNENAQTIVSLPVAGDAVAAGALSLNPSQVSFGSVVVGSSQPTTVTMSNSGASALTVNQTTLSGAGFAISNLALPLTLQPGDSAQVTVTFAPPASASFTGSVTFATTSNQVNANVVLNLSGTGAAIAQGALSPSPSSFAFGDVQIGANNTQSETLTNTGGSSVTISQAAASGAGFSISGLSLPATLAVNQTVSFSVIFTPASAGAATGSLSITSNASNSPLSIPLSGAGVTSGSLTANPTSLSFGSVQVGSSKNLSETLTNTGGSTVTLSQANLSGAAFSISGLSLPLTLTANQSVTFTATFAPSASGASSATLSVLSTAPNSPLNVGFSGTGNSAGQLAVTPTSLAFGNVTVGSSSPLTGTLTASGASVTISSSTLSNSEFVLSGISLPVTLAAGQSTGFTVTFTPQAAGATSASLAFSSNAANSPTAQAMTGTGTNAIQHTVGLTWTASANATGYNIYRSATNGGPYTEINTSLDGSAAYTDNTVVSGTTYYYVVTAVNSEAQESGYSNQAQAVVPSP